MPENLNTFDELNINPEDTKKSTEKTLSLIFLRIILCFILLSLCFLIKSQNIKMFNELSIWYKNNICYESINKERVYKEFISLSSLIASNIKELHSSLKE